MASDPRKSRIIFREPAAVGPAAEEHMRTVLRRFADLAELTARPHLPPAVSDSTVRVFALSIVGTLERVVIEWQDEQLEMPVADLADECVALFLAMLEGLAAR